MTPNEMGIILDSLEIHFRGNVNVSKETAQNAE